MKKIKWIFFIISLIGVCLFGTYILYMDLSRKGVFAGLKDDPSLFILVFTTLFSTLSFFFNLEKIANLKKKTSLYRVTRIGDMIFAIYFFVLSSIATYYVVDSMLKPRSFPMESWRQLLIIGIIVFMFLLSVLLFLDNFKFHASFKKLPEDETIDDIGRLDS